MPQPMQDCHCCPDYCIRTASCCGSACYSSPASISFRPASWDGCETSAASRLEGVTLISEKSHASCFDIAEHPLDSVRRPVDGDWLGSRRHHHGHHHCRPALG